VVHSGAAKGKQVHTCAPKGKQVCSGVPKGKQFMLHMFYVFVCMKYSVDRKYKPSFIMPIQVHGHLTSINKGCFKTDKDVI
jgi:hypothetical protein